MASIKNYNHNMVYNKFLGRTFGGEDDAYGKLAGSKLIGVDNQNDWCRITEEFFTEKGLCAQINIKNKMSKGNYNRFKIVKVGPKSREWVNGNGANNMKAETIKSQENGAVLVIGPDLTFVIELDDDEDKRFSVWIAMKRLPNSLHTHDHYGTLRYFIKKGEWDNDPGTMTISKHSARHPSYPGIQKNK
eukprot:838456_1